MAGVGGDGRWGLGPGQQLEGGEKQTYPESALPGETVGPHGVGVRAGTKAGTRVWTRAPGAVVSRPETDTTEGGLYLGTQELCRGRYLTDMGEGDHVGRQLCRLSLNAFALQTAERGLINYISCLALN